MIIETTREEILQPLTQIGGVVERRQTLPILANVLIETHGERLALTATDLEIEVRAEILAGSDAEGEFTVPARKLIDICKALPEGAKLRIEQGGDKVVVRSGRSRFSLGVLPAKDYPALDPGVASHQVTIEEKALKALIDRTHVAMAIQDVRYYLNGLFLEMNGTRLRAVATDGHRMALSDTLIENGVEAPETGFIVPRKAILELHRLLEATDNKLQIELGSTHLRLRRGALVFTTKLVDGRYPDYQRVIPEETEQKIRVDRDALKRALTRAAILSNEKYRGIRMKLEKDSITLLANNPEQEEAEEELAVDYDGAPMTIGFNVGYLIDVLGVVNGERVIISIKDSSSSALIVAEDDPNSLYVVMPLRL